MKKRLTAIILCICTGLCLFMSSAAETAALQGDANGDGKVSARDASLVLRYSVGLTEEMTTRAKINSDINRNGKMDAGDAALILRRAVGIAALQSVPALDTTLYNKLAAHPLHDKDYTEWISRTIQYLSAGDRKNVLYAAANHLGKAYSVLNCSDFLKVAFADAGIDREVYPGKSSEGVLGWFQSNHPERLHEIASWPVEKWKPAGVVIYLNPDSGKANHLALFVGVIDGKTIIMDSGSEDGVRLSELWEYAGWVPTYYADPWG
jgi:hypothetical protein